MIILHPGIVICFYYTPLQSHNSHIVVNSGNLPFVNQKTVRQLPVYFRAYEKAPTFSWELFSDFYFLLFRFSIITDDTIAPIIFPIILISSLQRYLFPNGRTADQLFRIFINSSPVMVSRSYRNCASSSSFPRFSSRIRIAFSCCFLISSTT